MKSDQHPMIFVEFHNKIHPMLLYLWDLGNLEITYFPLLLENTVFGSRKRKLHFFLNFNSGTFNYHQATQQRFNLSLHQVQFTRTRKI